LNKNLVAIGLSQGWRALMNLAFISPTWERGRLAR
jgi:hypothetical protein